MSMQQRETNGPLTLTIWKKQNDIVNLSIENEADIDLVDPNCAIRSTPLMRTIQFNNPAIVTRFHEMGADVQFTDSEGDGLLH